MLVHPCEQGTRKQSRKMKWRVDTKVVWIEELESSVSLLFLCYKQQSSGEVTPKGNVDYLQSFCFATLGAQKTT